MKWYEYIDWINNPEMLDILTEEMKFKVKKYVYETCGIRLK